MNPILARFQHEPAFIAAHSRAWFESCVTGAVDVLGKIEASDDHRMEDDFWYAADDWRSTYRPYKVKGGVLSIPVKGALVNGFGWQLGDWLTGYDYVQRAMERGMSDPDVKGIALVIDSPGGMVAGNFDLVDRMYAMRGRKPIKAYAAESAFSAAYSIASAADSITVTRSGGVGSVGVVTMHVDYSEAMEKDGIKLTFIYAGKHKVDGNPYEALPAAVRERIQDRIDTLYSEFVSIVARNRGMDEKAVRKTEALTYSAAEALDVGFADSIGALDDEITAFAASFTQQEDDDMAENEQAQITQADVDAARAEGMVDGAKAAVDRINAIIGSESGKARPKAALNAALKTSMSVEEATNFLGELPEEKAEAPAPSAPQGAGAPAGMMDSAMDSTNAPAVGSAGAPEMTQEQKDAALFAAAGLPGFKVNTK